MVECNYGKSLSVGEVKKLLEQQDDNAPFVVNFNGRVFRTSDIHKDGDYVTVETLFRSDC